MEKIEKLKQLVALLQNDTVTPQQVEKFLVMVIDSVRKSKEGFEQLSQETLQEVSKALQYIELEHEKVLQKTENMSQKAILDVQERINSVTALISEVKAIIPKDGQNGKDADEEYIISEVLNRIKLPEPKDIELDTGEEIVEKINQLSTDEQYQIDASHIKNLPTGGGSGSTARNLWQLNDVTISEPTNGQVLVYNSTTGQWENSSSNGSGDVTGPSSSTDNAIARFDGTTGKLIQDSGATLSDFPYQMSLPSSFAGGENTSDSTSRINLNSYQRAEDYNNFGEVARIYSREARSKQMLAWYKAFCAGTCTFTDSGDTWNATANYLEDTMRVVLSTTGTLPTGYSVGTTDEYGVTTGQVYYVVGVTADTFQLSLTKGGAPVVGTGTGSGTHSFVGVPYLKAWCGWHYLPNDVADPLHDHWSIETNDIDGLIRTRFEVVAVNSDQTLVNVVNANFLVSGGGISGVKGSSGTNREFKLYTTDPADWRALSTRWSYGADDTAESGSNVGSDFRISYWTDAGSYSGNAMFIKRSSGNVGFGTTDPTARVHIARSTNATGLTVSNSTGGGNTVANVLLESATSGSRVAQARITGDTTSRWSVEASGLMEWGAGGSSARDTNLYRASANNLKTDDNFTALSLISDKVTAVSSAGIVIEASSGTDVGILGAGNTANVTWYGSHNFDTVTASRVAQFGASKTLESSSVTTTELGYVSGVTSAIQTQINTIVNALTVIAQPDVGNSAGGADTTVYSFTVPANTIDGSRFRGIRVNLSCALSSTAETTTFKIKLNGVTCSTQSTANTSAIMTWYSFVVRSSSTTARSFGDRISTAGGASGDGNNSITSLNFAADQTFAITIASSTANRGTLSNLIVEYI